MRSNTFFNMVNLLLVNEPLNPLSLVTLLEAEYTISDRSILVVSPTDRHSPEVYNDDGTYSIHVYNSFNNQSTL